MALDPSNSSSLEQLALKGLISALDSECLMLGIVEYQELYPVFKNISLRQSQSFPQADILVDLV